MTDMFDQAKQAVAGNKDAIEGALDQVGSLIDGATGGQFHDQIEGAKSTVEAQVADGSLVDNVKAQAQAHSAEVGGILDQVGAAADQATGGKFHDQIEGAKGAAEQQLS